MLNQNRKLFSVIESSYYPCRDTETLDKKGDDINPLFRLPNPFDALSELLRLQ